jgi:cell division protein ZapB
MSTPATLELEAELARLEFCVEQLTTTLERLLQENRALHQRHEILVAERATLLSKHEQARVRVEDIVGRLKTLEHGT